VTREDLTRIAVARPFVTLAFGPASVVVRIPAAVVCFRFSGIPGTPTEFPREDFMATTRRDVRLPRVVIAIVVVAIVPAAATVVRGEAFLVA
jgi:hypothetical protein